MPTGGKPTKSIYPNRRLQSYVMTVREGLVRLLLLIVSLDQCKRLCLAPDQVEEALSPSQDDLLANVEDENKSNWNSTASATAKLILRGVNESADAFPPLKSVAGGLCFILKNCEVCPFPPIHYPRHIYASQSMTVNKQTIESLAHRINTLSASLCTPVSEGDTKEESRKDLEQ